MFALYRIAGGAVLSTWDSMNLSDRVDLIELIWSSRFDWVDLIESIWSKMASSLNFKLFRPNLRPNWTNNAIFGLNLGLNNLKFNKEAIFADDLIESIQLSRSDQVDSIKNGFLVKFSVV